MHNAGLLGSGAAGVGAALMQVALWLWNHKARRLTAVALLFPGAAVDGAAKNGTSAAAPGPSLYVLSRSNLWFLPMARNASPCLGSLFSLPPPHLCSQLLESEPQGLISVYAFIFGLCLQLPGQSPQSCPRSNL